MKNSTANALSKAPQTMHRQSGVAAIWLALTLVPIMGFTFWAVEGTRYVQEHSRGQDAAEAAAIAVTMQDQSAYAPEMARRYVEAYVRDIKSSEVSTVRLYQQEDRDNNQKEFVQYDVNVTTTHDSWFHSSFIPSFSEQQSLELSSLARKYPAYLGDKFINLALVADFSGSMKGNKVSSLKSAVQAIAEEVLVKREQDNLIENRLAVVPFNIRTQSSSTGNACLASDTTEACNAETMLRYKQTYASDKSDYSYEQINWGRWAPLSKGQFENCIDLEKLESCIIDLPDDEVYQRALRVQHVLDEHPYTSYKLVDHPSYVGYARTLNQMTKSKDKFKHLSFDQHRNNLYSTVAKGSFETIPFTNRLSDIERLETMSPNGGTAVYQGLLKSIKLLYDRLPGENASEEEIDKNENTIPMIIILSDGEENPYPEIFQNLVERNLCDRAREEIPGLFIGFVRIQYELDDADKDPFWICVTEEGEAPEDSLNKIVSVSNLSNLTQTIQDLIRQGSSGTGTTRLY